VARLQNITYASRKRVDLPQETRTRIGELEERCIVMRDPEGNGFCVQ